MLCSLLALLCFCSQKSLAETGVLRGVCGDSTQRTGTTSGGNIVCKHTTHTRERQHSLTHTPDGQTARCNLATHSTPLFPALRAGRSLTRQCSPPVCALEQVTPPIPTPLPAMSPSVRSSLSVVLLLSVALCAVVALKSNAAATAAAQSSTSFPLKWVLALALLLPLPLTFLAYYLLQSQTLRNAALSAQIAPASQPGDVPTLPQTRAKSHTTFDTDIVIVGAGVAGASLGAALGKRGYRCVVVERDLTEPSRIVGELLQPSGVAILRQMGLPECLEGFDAQRVLGYGIFQGDVMLRLDYPKDAAGHTHEGRAFHNGRFLTKLREALLKTKTELRQGSVSSLIEDPATGRVTGVNYKTADGVASTVTAPLTVVCDGLFSTLRGKLTTNTHQTRSRFLGLVLKDVDYPLAQGGNVILADPTPILLYPISSTEGRMLIDFPEEIPTNEQGELTAHLLEKTILQLPQKIRPAFERAVKEGNFKAMPNRQMGARPNRKPGTLIIGDALNVRHPLTGGGMTVAFTDVSRVLAGFDKDLKDFNDLASIDRIVAEHYETRGAPNSAINILADALYDVFGCKYGALRSACYDYLSQGGEKSAGPIRLLSGVSRSQVLLVCHFFSVALWGVGKQCLPFPTPAAVVRSYLMLRDANIIILPLLLQEHPGWPFRVVAAVLRTVFNVPYRSYVFPSEKAHCS